MFAFTSCRRLVFKSSAPPGEDQRENGLPPCQLHHPGAIGRGGLQGDALLRRQQGDGPNHSEERPGEHTSTHTPLHIVALTHRDTLNSVSFDTLKS